MRADRDGGNGWSGPPPAARLQSGIRLYRHYRGLAGAPNPLAIVPVAFLFGGLQVGGYAVQVMGIPSAIVSMLLGSLLFFVLAGRLYCATCIRRIH